MLFLKVRFMALNQIFLALIKKCVKQKKMYVPSRMSSDIIKPIL